MNIGDKIKIRDATNSYYDVVTLIDVDNAAVSVKYDNIPGVFTFSRKLVILANEEGRFSKKNSHTI